MNKRLRTSVVILAVFIAAFVANTRAQAPDTKPDLSGTWKMNITKSHFDPAPQPSAQSEIITLAGDDFTVDYTTVGEDGKQAYKYTLKIGGPETKLTPVLNETPLVLVSSKAEWKGTSLIVTSKITYQGGEGTMTSTYTLSPDGKTLTKSMLASISLGDFDLLAVYDKA